MNILDLYIEDGYQPKRATAREHHGPCPSCGGDDRFCLYLDQGEGKAAGMGTFHCGHGKGGNGCGKGGDAIEYLRVFRNLSFGDACSVLGIATGRPPASWLAKTPRVPKKALQYPEFSPRHISWPDDVTDPDKWQAHAEKFIAACHEQLLQRQKSLDYLAGRGISVDQIKKYRLGIHLGETRNEVEWEPSFRPRKSWGMTDNHRAGRPQMFILPAGLVIPWYNERGLRRIRIRLAKQDPQNPRKKYHVVVGSAMDMWLTGADREAIVTIETELDGIMIDGINDRVGVLALGAVAMKPDDVSDSALRACHTILIGLDFDEAGPDASRWWEKTYPQSRLHPVPAGKDPGELFERGWTDLNGVHHPGDVMVRAWIAAGLPAVNVPVAGRYSEKTAEDVKGADLPDHGSVLPLLKLVEQSNGVVRISDNGNSVGFACNEVWAEEHPDKRAAISDILYSAGEAADFVAALPDGSHNFVELRRFLQIFQGEQNGRI